MQLITFVCASPAASWTPTHNPSYGSDDMAMLRRHQPVGRCGADVYSYNKGSYRSATLKWENMPTADLTALEAFFNAISGRRWTFTYTDWNGISYTAWKAGEGLRSRYVSANRHEVTIDLEAFV